MGKISLTKRFSISTDSLSFRITIVFFCIWLPFCLVANGVFSFASHRLTQKTVQGAQENLSYFSTLINNDFTRINQQLYALCSDIDMMDMVNRRSFNFSYPQYLSYYDAYQKLRSYWKSSPYIDDLFLVLPNTQEELSANHSIIPLDKVKREMLARFEEGDIPAHIQNDQMIWMARGNNNVVMGAEISLSRIRDALLAVEQDHFYNFFFIDSTTGALLGAQVDPVAAAIHQELFASDGASPAAPLPEEIQVAGERYVIGRIYAFRDYFYLITYIPGSVLYRDERRLRLLMWFLNLAAVGMPVLMILVIRRKVHRPMSQLADAMSLVEKGDYSCRLYTEETSEFGYVFRQYNQMATKLENLIQEVLNRQLQVQQAQIKQLQAHINPHFLFNSLYIGYRMAKAGDTEKVAKLCMYLGDYFKFVTYLSEDYIPLSEEIRFTTTYLGLQQMRFGERLRYEIGMDPELERENVPNLIIQPLIENAIVHGVERVSRECEIKLEIRREGDSIRISVEDNGGGIPEEALEIIQQKIQSPQTPKDCYGLWNINWRLRYLYGSHQGILFETPEKGRLRVSFLIPYAPKDHPLADGEEAEQRV